MARRIAVWVLLGLALAAVTLAAALLRPRDVIEFFAGIAIGSFLQLHLALLGVGVAALAVGARLDRAPSQRRLLTRRVAGVAAALVAATVAWRELGAYSRDTVRIDADGASLAGTLYRPRGAPAAPALLLLHGSGDMPRTAYHFVARRFASRGFIVLNVDKRGVAGSSGKYTGDDLGAGVIERRVEDARPALAFLARQPGVDTARVGVFAISQGGWMVPLLLQGDTPARYAVCFSCAAVSSGEENKWSLWTNEQGDHFGLKPPPAPFEELDRRLRDVRPFHFDPREPLRRLAFPSIWLFGEWDSSLPAPASLRVIDSLVAHGRDITPRVFASANHGLMVVRGPQGSRLANFAPGVWDTTFAWLARRGVIR